MMLFVIAFYDRATLSYGRPMFFPSEGSALRAFTDEINRQGEDVMYKHPDDFDLYCLGRFDDMTGGFEAESPRRIVAGSQVKVARA